MGDSAIPVHSMSASFLNRNDIEETFRKDIMERFTKDEVGELCMSGPYILLIGQRMFKQNKNMLDKQVENRKTVMASMRQLGGLFLAFKAVDSQVTLSNQANGSATEPNASDMFQRRNFVRLESAIEAFTTKR